MPRWPATKTVLPFRSNGSFAMGGLTPGGQEIAGHHFLDELGERRLRLPAELVPRLAGIADQKIDLGRPEIDGIDANHGLAGFFVDAGFIDALAAPFDAAADFGERELDQFAHRMALAGRQHEIIGRIRLQNLVHALDIIPRMTPVPLGLEVPEKYRLLEAGLDARNPTAEL